MNLGRYRELEGLLKMKYRGRVHVFLYRDIADLQKMTGSGAVSALDRNGQHPPGEGVRQRSRADAHFRPAVPRR